MLRNRQVLLLDLPAIALAVFGAFVLRLDWFLTGFTALFWPCLLCALLLKPPVFFAFGLYGRYWRYASVREFLEILVGVSAASVALALAVMAGIAVEIFPGFPRSILFIDWLITLWLVGGIRLSMRLLSEARDQKRRPGTARARTILIVGAGEAGTMVAREMQRNMHLGMTPVGFLDDDRGKQGKRIAGVPVVGGLDALDRIVGARRPDEVIIAMPTAAGRCARRVTEACRTAGVPFRIMPGVYELLGGTVSVTSCAGSRSRTCCGGRRWPGAPMPPRISPTRWCWSAAAADRSATSCRRQVAASRPARLVLLGHGENSIFERRGRAALAVPQRCRCRASSPTSGIGSA